MKVRPRRLLLDTNLLVLLIVGAWDRNLIGRHRRLKAFAPQDLDLLLEAMTRFGTAICCTAHCLAEASNLVADAVGEPARTAIMNLFREFILARPEIAVESASAARDTAFARLGLADTGILVAAGDRPCVLTDDAELSAELQSRRLPSINFNHYRIAGWGSFST